MRDWVVYTSINNKGIHENWYWSIYNSKREADKEADDFNEKYINPEAWKCVCPISAVEALEIQNMPQWYYEGKK